jgi:uncharacterized protein (DUF488 family)
LRLPENDCAKTSLNGDKACWLQFNEESGLKVVDKLRSTHKSPFLFARQRLLLQLIDTLGGSVGKLDFQKLLFLYSQEYPSSAPYDFVPYKFGAFSFTSYADRRKLIERDLLVDDEQQWQITAKGCRAIDRTADMQLVEFIKRYRTLRGDDLVAETYRRFPYFASRSEIAARVLKGDHTALARIKSARVGTSMAKVNTIGYEGHTLESYLNVLLKGGITLVCDVRRNAISRKFGFSKTTLARSCEAVGIRYEHLPELGIESEQRQNLQSQMDYDALFEDYELRWLPQQTEALETINNWVLNKERVALTCFERVPHQCHRHCVAEALVVKFGRSCSTTHF